MGITEGDAERTLLGRTGPLWLARHVYRDQGDESTDWFHHWSQQQAKGECNNSHETHQSQITCLLRRKKNGQNKRQTDRQSNRHSQDRLDGSNCEFNEITYGDRALQSQSHADVSGVGLCR